jgi:hypothetical protein
MTTKLWIRTYKGRTAVLIRREGSKVRFSVADKEHTISKSSWDRLPLWTGPSPFLDEEKQGFSDVSRPRD